MSSWVGSGRGLDRVGDGSGSYWGRLRVELGGVGSGCESSGGRIGVVLGSTPCQVGWGRVRVWVESRMGRVVLGSTLYQVGWGQVEVWVESGTGRVGVGSTECQVGCTMAAPDTNFCAWRITCLPIHDKTASLSEFIRIMSSIDDRNPNTTRPVSDPTQTPTRPRPTRHEV